MSARWVSTQASTSCSEPRESTVRGVQMKVLVVDDEDIVRDLVKDAMTDQGYQVWTAPNGKEALTLGAEHQFDLVFCDVVMDGLGGFEVLKAFRNSLGSEA